MNQRKTEVSRVAQFTIGAITNPPAGSVLRNRMILKGAALVAPALSISLAPQDETTLPDGCRVGSHRLGKSSRLYVRSSFFHPTRLRTTQNDIAAAVTAVRNAGVEVVILEGIELLGFARFMRQEGLKIVLDMHNVESDLLAQLYRSRQPRNPFIRLRHYLKTRFAMLDEVRAHRLVDEIWACSELDAQRMPGRDGGKEITVIGNPVPDSSAFDLPIEVGRYRTCSLIYCGIFSYRPNEIAIESLVTEIMPMLTKAGLEPELIVAGRNPLKQFLNFSNLPNLRLISDPERMVPLMANAGFSIIPLRIGGGTRLKVLEAFAAGVVVIATPLAVEGCGAIAGQHYISATSNQEILNAMQTLLANPEQAMDMARNARALAHQSFHEDHLALLVQRRLEGLLAS